MAGRPQVPATAAGVRAANRAARLAAKVDKDQERVAQTSFEYRHALREANDAGVTYVELAKFTGRGSSSITQQIALAREEAARGEVPSRNGAR